MTLLVVFARSPQIGRVKTRLAATVGANRALEVYLWLLRHTISCAFDSGVETELWVDGAETEPRLLSLVNGRDIPIRVQPDGDLGDRMRQVFNRRLDAGPVLLIGSDCPQMSSQLLTRAARVLSDGAPLVLGPAVDGGYYLVGLNQRADFLFRDIAWSTPGVLSRTIAAARSHGVEPVLLEPLRDLDDDKDLAWAQANGLLG